MRLGARIRAVWASRPSVIERRLHEITQGVYALSIEEAERQVMDWLATSDEVSREATGIDPLAANLLPPFARRLLTNFGRIDIGELSLGGEWVTADAAFPDKVIIGRDIEHTWVMVARTAESVWVAEPGEFNTEYAPESYPSLPHYLLIVRETSQPQWWTKTSDDRTSGNGSGRGEQVT
jgi:hypothetical protein